MSEKKILVVSNMFPSKRYPFYGIFVKNFCDVLDGIKINYDKVVMCHQDNIFLKAAAFSKYYLKVYLSIITGHYDIVYVHYASHSVIPVLAAKKLKNFKLFTNCHGSDVVPENKQQESYQKNVEKMLKQSDRIVVPSEYFKRLVAKKYGISSDIIDVFPSAGVDMNVFHPYTEKEKEELRDHFGLEKNTQYVGFVGRLIPSKQWSLFVDLADELINKQGRKNIKFIVVGTGPDEEKLRSKIKALSLDEYFKIIPFQAQSDLAKLYNTFDVFAFPTFRDGESLGLVAIEAMACGVPVVATDHAAPRYYIEDGKNGYKFNPNDVESFAEKVSLILDHKQLRDSISIGALNTAYGYSRENIAEMMKNILEK